jgi:predicted nucleic acid-binding protein
MIDTMVLIYATRGVRPNDPDHRKAMIEASIDLVDHSPVLIVSALTIVEYMRGLRPTDDAKRVQDILARSTSLAVDGRVAKRAADLLQQRLRAPPSACVECLALMSDKGCATCKRMGSGYQRINDALIVATADLAKDVDVLHTFDGPMMKYAEFVTGCTILRPPHAGGALFDHALYGSAAPPGPPIPQPADSPAHPPESTPGPPALET